MLVVGIQMFEEGLHLLFLQPNLHLFYQSDELRLTHNAVTVFVHTCEQVQETTQELFMLCQLVEEDNENEL